MDTPKTAPRQFFFHAHTAGCKRICVLDRIRGYGWLTLIPEAAQPQPSGALRDETHDAVVAANGRFSAETRHAAVQRLAFIGGYLARAALAAATTNDLSVSVKLVDAADD